MMSTQYRSESTGLTDSDHWIPFLKQLHISSGVWTLCFMNGLSTGAPTVLIPQIRRDWNSTVTIDDELASWFYSASNLAALPWLLFLPALSQFIGRKIPYLTCSIAMITLFILLYLSSTPFNILIAQAIQGFVNAISVTITIHIIPEYCNHRYRNMYLNIQCTTFYLGMWVSNTIGTFLHWKYIAIVGLFCSLYSVTVIFYPESPRWLASKGKFAECEAAHRWLRGSGPEAEEELRDLIKSQADYRRDDHKMTCSGLMKIFKCRQFYMPLFLVTLVSVHYIVSGKFVCSIYAIDILHKITKSEDAAYAGMLVLDGVTVFGMYAGCYLSKFLKLRSLFISLSYLSICVMFTISLYLYLANLEVILENLVVTLGLLMVYSLSFSIGPAVVSINFYSELISLRYQAISYAIVSLIFLGSSTGMLKFSPIIFRELGFHGSFLFYGISCGIITTLLYIYLPETTNKTLSEIEDCFKDTARLPEAEILTKPVENEMHAS